MHAPVFLSAALAQAMPPAVPMMVDILAVAMPPAAVQQALMATIGHLPHAHPRRRRYRLAVPFDTPLFPPDDMLRDAPGGELEAWLALPRSQRRHDVLLLPDEDYYWPDGGAGEYSAQFLVHLAAHAAGTALAIVQVHARRRHGKAFRLLGRTGPGFYWDIRPSAPSPSAAAALADDLAQWLPDVRRIV